MHAEYKDVITLSDLPSMLYLYDMCVCILGLCLCSLLNPHMSLDGAQRNQ